MQLSYSQRAKYCLNPVGKALFELLDEKQTNLALSADVTSASQLLELADQVGPCIAVLKTHIDILRDFSAAVVEKLTHLAQKHRFMIFEDRKFADIGHTARLQYQEGIYRIASWADIVNAHVISGPSIIESLKEVGMPLKRGLLLIAEMSSKNSLATGHYTKKTVEWAQQHPEFVMGFIAQHKLLEDPAFIHMTPGVQLETGVDAQGQQYTTPHEVIFEHKSDMIIVGRGITRSSQPAHAAAQYAKAGWHSYQIRLSV